MKTRVIPTVFATNYSDFTKRFSLVMSITKYIHVDLMDGKFVEGKSISLRFKIFQINEEGYMLKITKQKKKAWVTFIASVEEVDSVELMGDWNDWTPEAMKLKKNGEFYLTKVLNVGSDYQFGYYSNGEWIPDETLNKIESPYGSYNSLLAL